MARILNGRALCQLVLKEVTEDVWRMKEIHGVTPTLGVILVGNRKDSLTYVRMKTQAANRCGIRCVDSLLSEKVSEEELLDCVDEMNEREDIHGILVQLPLPPHIREVISLYFHCDFSLLFLTNLLTESCYSTNFMDKRCRWLHST